MSFTPRFSPCDVSMAFSARRKQWYRRSILMKNIASRTTSCESLRLMMR